MNKTNESEINQPDNPWVKKIAYFLMLCLLFLLWALSIILYEPALAISAFLFIIVADIFGDRFVSFCEFYFSKNK